MDKNRTGANVPVLTCFLIQAVRNNDRAVDGKCERMTIRLPVKQLDVFREIIAENFTGGGGANTGIKLATGLNVDIVINHYSDAIANLWKR